MIGTKPQERILAERGLSPEEYILVSRILPHDGFVIVVRNFLCWDCIQKPVCAAHFVQTAFVLGPGQKFVHDDLCISPSYEVEPSKSLECELYPSFLLDCITECYL